MANSSSTITYDNGDLGASIGGRGGVRRIVIAWTSDDATGAVTATTQKVSGVLRKVTTIPDATAAPSANYDIAITDANSVDVLSNLGGTNGTAPSLANRHTSNTEVVRLVAEDNTANTVQIPDSSPYVCGALTVAVTNAGNSKQGQIIIYWTPE